MNWPLAGLAVLLALNMGTALAVVYTTHENRQLFVTLERLDKERDALNVEWGRLELEQGVWGRHSRVERIARERLHMVMPDATDTVYVSP